MLHLIFELSDTVVLQRLQNQAGVIFLNNSVNRLLKNSRFESALNALFLSTQCYVLNDDLALRGIGCELLLDNITPIDYTQFVQLTVNHSPIQTWN